MEKSRLETLSLHMVDLRAVLILLSPLNDLSAVQEVTGKIERIVARALILGGKLKVRDKVELNADGSETDPCSFSSDST